jgi:hypothetical protein
MDRRLGLGGVLQFLLHAHHHVQWFPGLSAIILSDAIPVMLLIRFAISIFALMLLGLALSLSAAQSEQETNAAKAATLTHQSMACGKATTVCQPMPR